VANRTHIIGIDPGLVHTGGVSMQFLPESHSIWLDTRVITGPDSAEAEAWIISLSSNRWPDAVYIEKYRPRTHLSTDERMVKANHEFGTLRNSKLLLNYGVKKVVTEKLMKLLGVWQFNTPTHHQDLRSAARIALLGMLKDTEQNALLTMIVRDHLKGETWTVHH